MAILGISIGTRRNGLAIIRNEQLKSAKVHTFNEQWSNKKLTAIISLYARYFKQYSIRVVVVKTPKASHLSLAIKQLIKAFDAYVKRQGCLVQYTTTVEIKKKLPSIKNKITLRQIVVEQYPILKHKMYNDMRIKYPYYEKVFEAVIAAHLHSTSEHR